MLLLLDDIEGRIDFVLEDNETGEIVEYVLNKDEIYHVTLLSDEPLEQPETELRAGPKVCLQNPVVMHITGFRNFVPDQSATDEGLKYGIVVSFHLSLISHVELPYQFELMFYAKRGAQRAKESINVQFAKEHITI